MVKRIAEVTYRFEVRPEITAYDRRSTDRLLQDLRAALEASENAEKSPRTQQESPADSPASPDDPTDR